MKPGAARDEDALSLQRHRASLASASGDDFAQRAWRLIVRRAPEEDAAGRLERGEVSRARLLRELVESSEFERVALLDDGLARALAERLKAGGRGSCSRLRGQTSVRSRSRGRSRATTASDGCSTSAMRSRSRRISRD